ncbi:hypothetical protein AAF712_002672 [Marasmius tenuissimus]|uniref:DUF7330 domain-containing protein n=1 Tax=Marasmius tenuissimus TaxID=585030 RepID=A0ABR3AC91_9AGAR
MKTTDHTPPPVYTADSTSGGGFQKTPCNYTRLVRENGPIKETFVVDPTIRVNEALLSPLTDAQAGGRNNLHVKAKWGEVDVNIHVVEDSPASPSNTPTDSTSLEIARPRGWRQREQERKRGASTADEWPRLPTKSLPSKLKLVVESDYGDVVVPEKNAVPYISPVKAQSGSIFLLLPRPLNRGVAKITADKRPIEISDQLSQITNTISEEGKQRKLIIGEVKGTWLNTDEKDELLLEASQRVFLQYVDEKFEKPKVEGGCIIC